MGMRSSDARWLKRDVVPWLSMLADAFERPGNEAWERWVPQARELAASATSRVVSAEPWDDGPFRLVRVEGPGRSRVMWNDYPVPYVEVQEDVGDYEILITAPGAPEFRSEPMSSGQLYATMFVLANGMAVAAGWTEHGRGSFPRNPHGPAEGLALRDQPGNPDTVDGRVVRYPPNTSW